MSETKATLISTNAGRNLLPVLTMLNAGTARSESLAPSHRINSPDLRRAAWPVKTKAGWARLGTPRFWGINE